MKTPKYRAWDKKEQLMCEVKVINLEKGCFLVGNSPTPDTYIDDKSYIVGVPEGHFVDFPDLILMEYTGLNDKKGVEIYDGDIVEITNKGIYNGYRVVVWDETLLSYVLVWAELFSEWKGSQKGSTYLKVSSGIRCLHVGNIYQTPQYLS